MALDILIIDDEDDIRDLIAGILEDEGFETRQAHDADSGLNEIARRRPSLATAFRAKIEATTMPTAMGAVARDASNGE